jgi:two-component system sensor histidine kinase AlgZ
MERNMTASQDVDNRSRGARARAFVGEVLLWALFCVLAFLVILLPLGGLALSFVRSFLVRAVIYSLLGTAVTAVVIETLARREIFRRFPLNFLAAGVVLVACALVSTVLGLFVNAALGVADVRHLGEEFAIAARFGLALTLVIGGSGFVYESLKGRLSEKEDELRARELSEARALTLAAEARLSALAARIHPHFIFNTLNSIAALIPEDPRRAEAMVERLSRLLRFLLDADARPLVPLEEELSVSRDYLELEQVRFGTRLSWRIDAPGSLATQVVPPLSIQTLAENSVKHAVAVRRETTSLRIRVRATEGAVTIEVADDGPGFEVERLPAGHGLDVLSARLQALYGAAARLSIKRRDGQMTVSVSLPRQSVGEEMQR